MGIQLTPCARAFRQAQATNAAHNALSIHMRSRVFVLKVAGIEMTLGLRGRRGVVLIGPGSMSGKG